MFMMVATVVAPLSIPLENVVVKADFPSTYTTYRRIDINASPYISADVNAVPVLIKFNSTDQSDMFGTGEDKDSIMFTSDSAGGLL